MVIHQGGLVEQGTLGSNLCDYLNRRRKQEIYKKQYGTDSDFRIIDKFYYGSEPYEQVYGVLDYKREGALQDGITYVEVSDYNETITSTPGVDSMQIVRKDVFILAANLNTNGYSRDQSEGWSIGSISVFKYIRGNPRPERWGLGAFVVIDGREVEESRNGVRVDLETVAQNLSFEKYMEWEMKYRLEKRTLAKKLLKHRDYLHGRRRPDA